MLLGIAVTVAAPMFRTLLVVLFLLLALIAPVWIPVRNVRALTSRPAATRMEVVRKGKRG